MRLCTMCNEMKAEDLFFFYNKENRWLTGCKYCRNKSRIEKRLMLGRTREASTNRLKIMADLKYSEALKYREENPEMNWAYLCKKFKLKYDAFKIHRRVRGIKTPGSYIREQSIGQPHEYYKRKSAKDRMREYQKSKRYQDYKKSYSVIWRENNRDKNIAYQKLQVSSLSDGYIKRTIKQTLKIPVNKIPRDIIEAKRQQLKLRRLCYEQN